PQLLTICEIDEDHSLVCKLFGILLAGLTILLAIIGIASFGITYEAYTWWPETGFYGGIIAGILNSILFFLKYKNK
ncbi:unnamed protein product, partial [marine sediment metagenome]